MASHQLITASRANPESGDRFADCFADSRAPELIEQEVATLVGQRVFGIALGYEDLVDHDELRHDPTMAMLAGKCVAQHILRLAL